MDPITPTQSAQNETPTSVACFSQQPISKISKPRNKYKFVLSLICLLIIFSLVVIYMKQLNISSKKQSIINNKENKGNYISVKDNRVREYTSYLINKYGFEINSLEVLDYKEKSTGHQGCGVWSTPCNPYDIPIVITYKTKDGNAIKVMDFRNIKGSSPSNNIISDDYQLKDISEISRIELNKELDLDISYVLIGSESVSDSEYSNITHEYSPRINGECNLDANNYFLQKYNLLIDDDNFDDFLTKYFEYRLNAFPGSENSPSLTLYITANDDDAKTDIDKITSRLDGLKKFGNNKIEAYLIKKDSKIENFYREAGYYYYFGAYCIKEELWTNNYINKIARITNYIVNKNSEYSESNGYYYYYISNK